MLRRAPIKHHAKPQKPPEIRSYFEWLSSWPCYVCLSRYCAQNSMSIAEVLPEARTIAARWTTRSCGRTEVAHVGIRGLSQKCEDTEVMPLGLKHHQRGPEAHHVHAKGWFERVVGEEPERVFVTLQTLYKRETEGIQIND
jgi:hypothetical protein